MATVGLRAKHRRGKGKSWAFMLAALMLAWPHAPATAQDRALLIADRMVFQENGQLLAQGNVEARYKSARLTAAQMLYDRSTDTLTLTGPIVLDDGAGVVVLADFASLSADMQNGLLQSARLILDQQLQMASARISRSEGRFLQMENVAASSCKICTTSATPLWEIRATSVMHDRQTQQIYFEGAQFRMFGVPLAYLPRLRIPDPTQRRAIGFLPPRFQANSRLGLGVKLPYFIPFGPHRDLTIAPFASNLGTRSVDLRYRQALATGTIEVNAALSRDGLTEQALRGYILANGQFTLPRGYQLALQAETVSDSEYFRGYGLEERDRLVTSVTIDRTARNQYDFARLQGFYSIRSDEVNTTQPSVMAEFNRQQRFDLGGFGVLGLTGYGHARLRASQSPNDGPDPDNFADGRDVTGFGLRADWTKGALTPQGILLNFAARLQTDNYHVAQDTLNAGEYTRSHYAIAAEMRYPLIKTLPSGAQHMLEPMAQIVLAPQTPQRLFNEDSALVEFDEGNLFSLSRFPGTDQIEAGSRANIGLRYSVTTPLGTRAQIVLGRVYSNFDGTSQFAKASGLGQKRSDWLVAGQLDMNNQVDVTMRTWLDTNTAHLRKFELRSSYRSARQSLSLGYLFAPADTDEARAQDIREISFSTQQQLSRQWQADLSARYDGQSDKFSRFGLGLGWRNECLRVDLSLSRSFTSSATVPVTTDFGLTVAFLGIGGQAAGPASQCRG